MPIYEYICNTCGSEFEAIQKFSDNPLTECACGESGGVERKLSLSAFQLKGGGWYKDKYATGGSAKGASTPEASDSSGSSGSSSDSSASTAAAAHACAGSCACG